MATACANRPNGPPPSLEFDHAARVPAHASQRPDRRSATMISAHSLGRPSAGRMSPKTERAQAESSLAWRSRDLRSYSKPSSSALMCTHVLGLGESLASACHSSVDASARASTCDSSSVSRASPLIWTSSHPRASSTSETAASRASRVVNCFGKASSTAALRVALSFLGLLVKVRASSG